MALSFSTPLDVKRPYGSFRFDVFSLKADRRMTLYGKAALCQFIELESDFEVTALCERPLLIPDIKPKRLRFFGDEGLVVGFRRGEDQRILSGCLGICALAYAVGGMQNSKST